MVRPSLQLQQPSHSRLRPCPLHRICPRMRLGDSDTSPAWINATISTIRRLYRSVLRWRLHRRSVLSSRYRQRELLQVQHWPCLRKPWSIWHVQQSICSLVLVQQELLHAQGCMGVRHHEHHILLHHRDPSFPAAPTPRRARDGGQGKGRAKESPWEQKGTLT